MAEVTVARFHAAYARGERNFTRWSLARADLHGMDLRDTIFFDANLGLANLEGADLSRANLAYANLRSANLRNANISDAYMEGAHIEGADMTDVVRDSPSSQLPKGYSDTSQDVPVASTPVASAPVASTSATSVPATATHQFCMYCGATLPNDAAFCRACGKQQLQAPVVGPVTVANALAPTFTAPTLPPTSMSVAPQVGNQYGALIKQYKASPIRYGWFLLTALALLYVFGALFALFNSPSPTLIFGFLFWLVIGSIGPLYFYYRLRNVGAWIYERGFIITRGDKTTSGRWEDIAGIQHRITTTRLYLVIPISRRHTYKITMKNGQRESVTNAFFNEGALGDTIQQKWVSAMLAQRQSPS